MKKLLLLLFLPIISFGQDNILLKDGEEVAAKVLRVNPKSIEYRKYSNLDGPVYTLDKADVFMIKYENGGKDVFTVEESRRNDSSEIDEDAYKALLKRNNVVYIECENNPVVTHATEAINRWGYFRVTKDKGKADLILRFMGRVNAAAHWAVYIQFIDPVTNQMIGRTKEHHSFWGRDINSKRGAVKKVIDQEIKPLCF
jgi:hypothetical protein